jgi:hypothetical protein
LGQALKSTEEQFDGWSTEKVRRLVFEGMKSDGRARRVGRGGMRDWMSMVTD